MFTRLTAVTTSAICVITVALLEEVINHFLCRLPRLIQQLQVCWIGDIGRRAGGINAERAPVLTFRSVCWLHHATKRELITVCFIISTLFVIVMGLRSSSLNQHLNQRSSGLHRRRGGRAVVKPRRVGGWTRQPQQLLRSDP